MLDALGEAAAPGQVRQLVPGVDVDHDAVEVDALATALRPELVQLWYQMALHGRRDLQHAPSPRSGFEMTCCGMLAFRPPTAPASSRRCRRPRLRLRVATRHHAAPRGCRRGRACSRLSAPAPDLVARPERPPEPRVAPPKPEAVNRPCRRRPGRGLLVTDTERWLSLVARSSLRGPVRLLAEHAAFVAHQDGVLRLSLAPGDEHLKSPSLVLQLGDALASMLGGGVRGYLRDRRAARRHRRVRHARERESRQAQAEQHRGGPHVQRLVEVHGARICRHHPAARRE